MKEKDDYEEGEEESEEFVGEEEKASFETPLNSIHQPSVSSPSDFDLAKNLA